MTEADRYLEERLRQQEVKTSPVPPLPFKTQGVNYPVADDEVDPSSSAQASLGVKWLNFVTYGLVPFNMICLLVALIPLATHWKRLEYLGANPGNVLFFYLVDLVMLVALFIGLQSRASWAWWLMMAALVVKAPLGALSRISPTKDPEAFSLVIVLSFFFFCMPQLVYFYRRRSLFHVVI